jgi:hypothetical protein
MDRDVVLLAHGDGDATLRMNRTALKRMALRKNQYSAALTQLDGRTQTGDPAPDDEKIG